MASRRFPWLAAALVLIFTLPALANGWILDDYYHRAVLREHSRFRAELGPPADMFRFFRGDEVRNGKLVDAGLFPWWTDLKIKGEFLQAITVLTHRLDYSLWPNSALLMHAQSLLWLVALVMLAACFYRRLLGATWVAGAAALAFALDDARGATAGLICNRNVLIAATFGVGSLIAHDRARRTGDRAAAIFSPLLLAAALFSKEEGVGTCSYFAAYALLLDPRGPWRGALAQWPQVLVFLVWAVLRSHWGFGVGHMGVYIDPLGDTARFLEAAAVRLPILLLGQWSPILSDFAIVLRGRELWVFWTMAVALLAVLFALMVPLLRREAFARFCALGMILATIPVGATFPMDRLLTFPALGASGLLAQYLAFVFGRGSGAPTSRLWRIPARALGAYLVLAAFVLAPLHLPFRAANPVGPMWVEERLHVHMPSASSLAGRTLVVVNAPSVMHANYLFLTLESADRPLPERIRTLAPAMPWVKIRRVDDRTLAITPGGGYLKFVLDRIFRDERWPLAPGTRVTLSDMVVTVVSVTADGRPAEASFQLAEPLESPTYVWLCYRGDHFEPFVPPKVGEEMTIPFDWNATLAAPREWHWP